MENQREFIETKHEKPWRYEEDGLTVTRSAAWTAPGCHEGCGVLMYTDAQGKLVKVEGDPEDPYNQGRLCVRCLDLPEVVYSKDRLMYPMRRDKALRGKDAWERISWEEAIDEIGDKLQETAREFGPESVVFLQGTGRDVQTPIGRLAWTYGSPNYGCPQSGIACYMPRIAMCASTTGSMWISDCSQQFQDRYDNPDYEVPEVMIVWGNYPIKSNADGFFGHWVIDLMKRGTKIVMADPRMTWLGKRAEVNMALRPGTDALLAIGMLQVIINEDIYDHDFVENWCYGFDELKARVNEYDLDDIATRTWVPVEQIKRAARIVANAKSACLQWGVAVDMTKESFPAGQALMAFVEITGNIDVPGGMMSMPTFALSIGFGLEHLPEEQAKKRLGLDRYPVYGFGYPMMQPDVMIEAMETAKPYEIRGLWLQTTNTATCMGADPKRFMAAAGKMDFIYSVDLYMTPTIMALADIVLPALTFPERNGLMQNSGAQRGITINKAIESLGECKSDYEINLLIGKKVNPEAWPWETVEDMLEAIVGTTGYTFDRLRNVGPAYEKYTYRKHELGLWRPDGTPGFNTPTGKIELYSTAFEACGLDPLPYFDEPDPGPVANPDLLEEYPLVMTTGARNWSLFHSEHRQIPRLRAMHPDPIVQMHPDAVERYGLHNGDWVWVEAPMGRFKRRIQATREIIDPRVVSTDHGWWFPEADPENLYDMMDLNSNNCFGWVPGKSGFGANYKTNLVKVYRVAEGE